MMKILFATTNPAKVLKYKKPLEEEAIELITLKDLGFNLKIEENGKDALENAYLKANAYYEATGIPTIGMDNSLFIEELPESKQPGTYVRRVNGKELTDDEMISYYTGLVKENGGRLTAKWVFGMVICSENVSREFSWYKDHFYFVSEPSSIINPGYPLDSISVIPEFNKYFAELTEEEKEIYNKKDNIEEVINFVLETIAEIEQKQQR